MWGHATSKRTLTAALDRKSDVFVILEQAVSMSGKSQRRGESLVTDDLAKAPLASRLVDIQGPPAIGIHC